MRHLPYYSPRLLIAGFLGSALVAAAASAAEAPKIAPEAAKWPPAVFAEDEKARINLSGAACVPTTPKFTSCLIANDDKKYAQFFSIDGTTLIPGEVILLSDAKKDPDAEGVAYGGGNFYITGSHGRSRSKDNENESSYVVFRFPADPTTGKTPFKVSADKVVGVTSSGRLHHAIHDLCVNPEPFADDCSSVRNAHNRRLADGGINIEGIAFKDGRLHFGLRGPSQNGNAYLLSVDADALFKDTDLKSKATALPLGPDTGIRDLAAISDGILVLAGPTRSEDVDYAVWLWDGVGNSAKQLATLDLASIDGKGKAEILLPLEEDNANIRVLVMFDGIENGGAVSFKIPR
jgi:hypothetical protein